MPKNQKKAVKKPVRAVSSKSRRVAAAKTPARPPAKRSAASPARAAKAPIKPKQSSARKKGKVAKPAARTLILPPKSERAPGRIAPLPPRTPSSIEGLVEAGAERERASRVQKTVAPVVPLRAPSRRPKLTQETWQKLEQAAARLQRCALTEAQRSAIRAALEGRDTLVVIPDDLLAMASYQLCAPLLEQPTVVLSPVLSDLQEQAAVLAAQRQAVVCLAPESSGPERSTALGRISRGGPLLVLLSPEALGAADVQKALQKSGIALFVVEEAHCASALAHETRPFYGAISRLLETLARPPLMALTRVASRAVLASVTERLALQNPILIQAPAVPANLRLVTQLTRGEQRQPALVRLVERLEPPGIVFCASPHDVDSVYSALRHAHEQTRSPVSVHRYHAGMTPGDRAAELLNFSLPGARAIMVAVSAFAAGSGFPGLGEAANVAPLGFGRGAGKRDVRFVVHYQSPASVEQYLREIQRAGRDGLAATCVLFHDSSHRSLHEVMLAQQRFRTAHLVELGRALEALEGRMVTLESLALATGQSRRTTDRLSALLADAGVVSRAGGWVRVTSTATELVEACRELGTKLNALREQDEDRLSAISALAEQTECKRNFLNRYLGEVSEASCGQCSACSTELLPADSALPQAAARRPIVQEFSVRVPALAAPHPAPAESGAFTSSGAPLTAKLTDFGAVSPRAAR